ncbi:MAG: ImmA/IrrE family metallo-endopeptidase [Pusillimonas sp.]|nr:ImmA/IrrE family metallo-endopeptidase [Pusillimonas sp.]HCN73332.1 DNA-binding protein [Pusillimonas sp.]
MEQLFVGASLRLARLFSGLTLEELAEKVGKSKQFIHKLETNIDRPTETLAAQLAASLGVLPTFFYEINPNTLVEEQIHFRKLRATKVAVKHKAIAKAEFLKQLINFCEQRLILPNIGYIDRSVHSLEDIEQAAEDLRAHFELGYGPIKNITRVAENAGTFVTTFRELSSDVDALSISCARPLIVRNEHERYSCRLRFDIAHEIGHFVMHAGIQTGDRQTESEANRFAGAFLLPRRSFAKEFPISSSKRISWKALAELKLRWGASKAALLMRGRQLHLIDDYQLKGAFISLKNTGQAKKEHEDDSIEIERPVLLDKAIRFITRHYSMSLDDMARELRVTPRYITEFLSQETIDELTLPAGVTRMPNLRLV